MSTQALRMVDSLPPLRAIAAMLRAFAQADASADLRPLIEVLGKEPGVTARVIAVANSAYYAPLRPVASVEDAAVVLGIRTLKTVVLGVILNAPFDPSRCAAFSVDRFWTDAFMTAVSTGYVVEALPEPPPVERSTLYALGLVHSLGLLLLADQAPEALTRALERSDEGELTLLEAERAELDGLDHYESGAQLLEHWGLPVIFPVTLRDLGAVRLKPSVALEPVTAIVARAKGLVAQLGHGAEGFETPLLALPDGFVEQVRAEYEREHELALQLAQMLTEP
ncbi:MAG: HDOD domain-containing protein [Chromatiales bacterium]